VNTDVSMNTMLMVPHWGIAVKQIQKAV